MAYFNNQHLQKPMEELAFHTISTSYTCKVNVNVLQQNTGYIYFSLKLLLLQVTSIHVHVHVYMYTCIIVSCVIELYQLLTLSGCWKWLQQILPLRVRVGVEFHYGLLLIYNIQSLKPDIHSEDKVWFQKYSVHLSVVYA